MKTHTPFSKLAAILVMCGLGFLIISAFRPNFSKLLELQTLLSVAKQKLVLEEKRNACLKEEFDGLSSDPVYIEKVAREKLGWCRPTETVVRFSKNSSINNTPLEKK